MSVPSYLTTTYRFLEVANITDVQSIIDGIWPELQAMVWTNPSAGQYRSPNDAVGRFCKAVFTRVDQANLKLDMLNQNLASVGAFRIQIDTTGDGSMVRFYATPFGFMIDSYRSVALGYEAMGGAMLDQYPFNAALNLYYTWAQGFRTSIGGVGLGYYNYLSMKDGAYSPYQSSQRLYVGTSGSSIFPGYTQSGKTFFHPMECFSGTAYGGDMYAGRMYQMVALQVAARSWSNVYILPIDVGVTAQFRTIVGFTPGAYGFVWACRVG